MQFAVAFDIYDQFFRKRVYDANAYAMQTARDLIGVFIKFTACMKHGKNDRCGWNFLRRVHIDRYTASIIADDRRAFAR